METLEHPEAAQEECHRAPLDEAGVAAAPADAPIPYSLGSGSPGDFIAYLPCLTTPMLNRSWPHKNGS